MKPGLNNVRQSSVEGIVHEPKTTKSSNCFGSDLHHDLAAPSAHADVIAANRMFADLKDVAERFFTRDLFKVD